MGKGITKPQIKIYDLLKWNNRKKVTIQPKFQREFVWKVKQQKNLIKSLSTGIPIPYFYFAKLGKNSLEVIDGQQRLTTIFGYIDLKSVLEGARERISKDLYAIKELLDTDYSEAVSIDSEGYYVVDYTKLGFPMMELDEVESNNRFHPLKIN